jgi:hypothetical protein
MCRGCLCQTLLRRAFGGGIEPSGTGGEEQCNTSNKNQAKPIARNKSAREPKIYRLVALLDTPCRHVDKPRSIPRPHVCSCKAYGNPYSPFQLVCNNFIFDMIPHPSSTPLALLFPDKWPFVLYKKLGGAWYITILLDTEVELHHTA